MSRISSPVKELRDLYIEAFPKDKIITPDKVMFYDGVVICTSKDTHHLYCNRIRNHCYYASGEWPSGNTIMRILLRLKIITKAQMQEHLVWVKDMEVRRDKQWKLKYLEEIGQKYAFEVSPEQRKALEVAP